MRVVITGVGLVTPVGNTTSATWNALCAGISGIEEITSFDTSDQLVTIAGEVRNLDVSPYMDRKEQRRHDRFVHLGIVALMEALQQSGLDIHLCPDEVGLLIGSVGGGQNSHHLQHRLLLEKGPQRLSPHVIHQTSADALCGYAAILTGARGPNFALVSGSASGATAIGEAFEIIRRGDALAMIAGGVDSCITPFSVGALANARALSRHNDDPTKASRPFDAQRDGFVLSEGGGILILENLEFALARQAPILGEVVGYGMANDAYHITAPSPEGAGLQRAMQLALKKAHVLPRDVQYIHAHGTSTPVNDRIETLAIKEVFGEHVSQLAISSTKSMMGHTLGAAGAIGTAIALLAIRESIIPPTINLENPDPACDLDYVPQTARSASVHLALSNSCGFGGQNVCLALRAWEAAV